MALAGITVTAFEVRFVHIGYAPKMAASCPSMFDKLYIARRLLVLGKRAEWRRVEFLVHVLPFCGSIPILKAATVSGQEVIIRWAVKGCNESSADVRRSLGD